MRYTGPSEITAAENVFFFPQGEKIKKEPEIKVSNKTKRGSWYIKN